jgi:hypothetical protein
LVAQINAGTGVINAAHIDAAIAAHSSAVGNPHGTTATQIDAQGGVNRLVAQINAGTGVINAAHIDAAIAAHSSAVGNPHGTTAAQIDAQGGVNRLAAQINAGTGVINAAHIDAAIAAHALVVGNPHGTTAAQVGAIAASGGGTIEGTLVVHNSGTFPNERAILGFLSGNPKLLYAEVNDEATYGIFVASTLNPATVTNKIEGRTQFTGLVIFDVAPQFNAGKGGYVVDQFINADKSDLRTGDVVKLRGTPVARFMGHLNRLPIPEVALADKDDDPAVIGVVHLEATPNSEEPDFRTDPNDPTTIPQGGQLHVVTLGTFSHCKVDASEVPIEVGDLLTSSSKPGFAKKATHPKLGSLIGKALEPLREGTGYISVFINIQ